MSLDQFFNPNLELLPDATDDNEGYDVCNDEDED